MASPVAFILGAGAVVGKSVAQMLQQHGYKVAVGSRHPDVEDATREGFLPVVVDVTKSQTVCDAFKTVEKELGAPANVVVYNAASWTSLPTPGDPLSLPTSAFEASTALGVGAFGAAQHAVSGFRTLETSAAAGLPKVFIVTGNIAPFRPPSENIIASQAQKKISAYLVELLANRHSHDGYRFYFASQVSTSGGVPGKQFSGPAHAAAYWDLISAPEQKDWDYRFTMQGSPYLKANLVDS